MDLQLQGKRALVCAASRGLGYATASALAREGAEVFICARSAGELEVAAHKLGAENPTRVHAQAADLSRADDVTALLQKVSQQMGGVDILVYNVGGPAMSLAATTPPSAWQQGFTQLFLSAVHLITPLLPPMQKQGYGRIIAITSLSVAEPIDGLAVSTAMRASLTAWLKQLASEVAASGITVNCLMPGVIHTQRIEDLRRAKAKSLNTTLDEEMQKTAATIPAGRLGRPEELAALAAFLASPLSAYITGQNIAVDGGQRRSVAY